MKRIRFAAAGMLVLAGLLQILEVGAADAAPSAIITAVFGILYIVIAIFLFRDNLLFYYAGAAVPLAGLLYAIATLILLPSPQTFFFIVADLVTAGCCAYLISRNQA
jgi:peptidoglycan/LPS O-acetylase OafA/YrhL